MKTMFDPSRIATPLLALLIWHLSYSRGMSAFETSVTIPGTEEKITLFIQPHFETIDDWISYLQKNFDLGQVIRKHVTPTRYLAVLAKGPHELAVCDYQYKLFPDLTGFSGIKQFAWHARFYDSKTGQELDSKLIDYDGYGNLTKFVTVARFNGFTDPYQKMMSGNYTHNYGHFHRFKKEVSEVVVGWPKEVDIDDRRWLVQVPGAPVEAKPPPKPEHGWWKLALMIVALCGGFFWLGSKTGKPSTS